MLCLCITATWFSQFSLHKIPQCAVCTQKSETLQHTQAIKEKQGLRVEMGVHMSGLDPQCCLWPPPLKTNPLSPQGPDPQAAFLAPEGRPSMVLKNKI